MVVVKDDLWKQILLEFRIIVCCCKTKFSDDVVNDKRNCSLCLHFYLSTPFACQSILSDLLNTAVKSQSFCFFYFDWKPMEDTL